ncbi:hypothetical protein BaRGS_00009579, partial [Batillaria attramentaria]
AWEETVTKVNENEFVLSNKETNRHLYVDKFPISFQGQFTGEAPKIVCAYVEGQDDPHDCHLTTVATTPTTATTTIHTMRTTSSPPICSVCVAISSRWPNGFNGSLTFPTPGQLTQWKVHLSFDKPVDSLDAFEAGVRKASDRDYELMSTFFTHPSHNAHLTVYFEGYSHDPPATVCGGHHTPTVTSGLEFRFLDNTDPGKFMAQVDLPIPHPMNGWTVHLLFDKPLYSLQGLEENVRKVNEYEFVLTSMNSNSHEISKIPIIFQANATGELPTRCLAEYLNLHPQHTMCQKDVGKAVTLSSKMIQAVVDRHNAIRREVSPPATNMQKLVWDDRLAEVAAKRARQCVLEHEANDSQRAMPDMPGVHIGQNGAAGDGLDLLGATDCWYSEIANYSYGVPTPAKIGHYTQEIWADTGRFGCGEANCEGTGSQYPRLFFCNYAEGGNDMRHRFSPYQAGGTCGACPNHCDEKLCDCGGLVCYNGGTINIASCTCSCHDMFSGYRCEQKHCPASDNSTCQLCFDSEGMETCCQYTNVPPICPYACGLCP